jgi:type I restriction enzyme, S subunit
MNPYPSYKESSVEWTGQTPSQWELKKPKYFLHKMEREPLPSDDVITCFRDGVVTLRKNRRTTGFTNSLKEIGYQRILKGDLVVHEMDGFEGSIGVSDSVGKSTPVYTVIEQNYNYEVRYWMYLLREMSKTGFIESISRSIRERTTEFRWKMWRDLYFGVPSLQEQQQISNYLDHKTQQIDSLIEKTQQKIELLKEQRTSLINQVVTKGLNPDVEMKDSGVEWVGKIPSGWYFPKLKYHFNYQKGQNGQKLTKEFIGENPGVYPVYSGTTKKSGMLGFTNEYEFDYEYPVIFVSTVGSDTTVMTPKVLSGKFSLSQNCLIMIPKTNINSVFINYFLLFHFKYLRELLPVILKEGHRSVGMTDLDTYNIVFPPLPEQQQIVDHLDKETTMIDSTIVKETERIELLKEYRQSLISEVVTGKMDVRDEVLV